MGKRFRRATRIGIMVPMLLIGGSLAFGQLPVEPSHNSGLGITGAFEGWFKNPDGTFSLLAGYFNRNAKEELDIPVGPNNKIEPGPPDQGQPTHFAPRRQWGVFRIVVPKDFGDKKFKWTIVANGKTNSIPLSLNPLWEISPLKEESMGNTPPVITFPQGSSVQGPLSSGPEVSATVGVPLELKVDVADDAKVLKGGTPPKTPPLVLTWSMFRGPAPVEFSSAKPQLPKFDAPQKNGVKTTASTSATFTQPGQYILLVVANDWSGEGGRGFQCCWTTSHVKVNVKGGQ
ncbi:MAG TPA: hypothetical protein VG273_24830 [Bryobacteraceae bacterium]|jgi:hypothetical protein|nr:hypothetical protein [Bryobacteraceae bacterium]